MDTLLQLLRDLAEEHPRDDIRDELRRRGLSPTGLKAALAVRLADASQVTLPTLEFAVQLREQLARDTRTGPSRVQCIPLAALTDDGSLQEWMLRST
jgi:hypothetical protein